MSRFSRLNTIVGALVATLASLALVPTAFADNSLTPYGQKAPAPKPAAKTVLLHHGLELKARLTAKIQDGKPATFFTTVTKNGDPLQFGSAAIIVSLDGLGQRYNGVVTNATFGPDGQSAGTPVDFVDLGRQWVRLGTLATGKAYKLTGQVAVVDRAKPAQITGDSGKPLDLGNTTFFCIQLVVRGTYPGMPNATWTEESKLDCRQFSVAST